MDFESMDISPELREKAKACTSPEELLALAKREGIKLGDRDLEAVAGGIWSKCPSYEPPPSGDVRESIDPELAHADFVNGAVDGGELA